MADDDAGWAIRTPDQRVRVFVSSTLAELADERAVVARAITSLGLAPVMFELGARPHPPQELYRAYLAQSDIFVGLYWQSYGWVGPGMHISGLEDEFQLSKGKPRLLYLKAPAPDRHPQLSEMIDRLRSEGDDAYRTFGSQRELGRLVRDDLALLLSERFVSAARHHVEPRSDDPKPARRTLPLTATSLIGRDHDVAQLAALITRGDVRLVTVSGPGGVGKTRIAIAVGETLEASGTPAVVFVSLAVVSDVEAVLPRIAEAVGAILEGTRPIRDQLVDHFADTPTVLILDNLEQVAEAGPRLDELLTLCPALTILATSRVALRLRAEHEYVLRTLPGGVSPPDLAIDRASAAPAVRLFVERAAAVGRTIELTERNLEAVVEICRRLDGLPLAIELAAARCRILDPHAILVRLENVLDALGTGPVDLPERQRGLRATIDWSVGLLDDDEREMLAALAVFSDGWSLPAAAAVGGHDEDRALDLLDSLAGHSLVSVDAQGDEPRFRMLNTVREFAADLPTAVPRDELERRHAQFFAAISEAEVPREDVARWTEQLRVEEENLRLALRWFFDNDPTRVPHLLRSLWLHWQISDRMSEARSLASELRRRFGPGDLDPRAAGELLFSVAVTATEVGDDTAALAAVDAMDELGVIDDASLRDVLMLARAWILPLRGDLAGALTAAEQAYAGFAGRGDVLLAAAALTLGMLKMALDDDDAARSHLEELDELGDRFDIQWLTASARTHLTLIDLRAGDTEAARTRLRRTVDALEDRRTATLSACLVLTAYGYLSLAEKRPLDAARALGAMQGLRRRAGVEPWPNSREGEAELRRLAVAATTSSEWQAAFAEGDALRIGDALGMVRSAVGAER